MAVTRRTGNNPLNPRRKPARRRAPLRANGLTSAINQDSVAAAIADNLVMRHSSGVLKPNLSSPTRKRRQPIKPVNSRSQVKQSKVKLPGNVPVVPASEVVPFWLKKLQQVQRYSSIATFALVSATLAVYALNVYSQQSWGNAYKELQQLQKNEQQLTTKNEVLKNKIAGEAEKDSTGLVSPSPSAAIFIPSASSSPSSIPTENQQQSPKPDNRRIHPTPMGY